MNWGFLYTHIWEQCGVCTLVLAAIIKSQQMLFVDAGAGIALLKVERLYHR